MKGALIAAVAFFVVAGGYFLYQRSRPAVPLSESARICAADFPEMPREQTEKRCACVIGALEKSEDGQAVLKLILEHKQFLKMIESAASHASVLDAMNECGQ